MEGGQSTENSFTRDSGEAATFDAPMTEAALSDDDFFASLERDAERNSVNNATAETQGRISSEQEESLSEREQTIERLTDFYGSEILYYGSYKGTIGQIIDDCPAFGFVVTQGFDKAVSWIEANRQSKPVTDPEEDAEDKNEAVEDFHTDNDEEKVGDDVDTAREDSPIKESIEKSEEVTPITEPVVSKESEPATENALRNDTAHEAHKRSSGEEEKQVKPTKASAPSAAVVDENEGTVVPLAELIATRERAPAMVPISNRDDSNPQESHHFEKDTATIPVVQDEIAAVLPKEDLVAESTTVDHEDEGTAHDDSLIERVFINQALEEEDHPASEADNDTELVARIPSAEDEDGNVDELLLDTNFETSHDTEPATISDYFFDWHELAKNETSLDDLFVTIIEQLEPHTEAEILSQSEQDETVSDDEEKEESYLFEEALLRDEAPVELYGMLLAVRNVQTTLDQLYRAKTQEECKVYVDQLVYELAIVLRSLGYDNPEKIIREFLKTHSPESLNKLLQELEISLRRMMAREIHTKRAGHRRSRSQRLAKVVSHVMQLLIPKAKTLRGADYA